MNNSLLLRAVCVRTVYARTVGMCTAALVLAIAGGCSALRPVATPPPLFYSLDGARIEAGAPPAPPVSSTAPTLIVNPTHASAGFGSQRIIYVRTAQQIEYFSHNEWVDTPARMLAPLIVAAIERSGSFRAAVLTPSAAAGELRLDTDIVRLQHDFGSNPSHVRFTLRAYVVDNATRQVLGWREFDETAVAASGDPAGGVAAANLAVQKVLTQLAGFCTETAALWQRAVVRVPKRDAAMPVVR